MKTLGKFLRNRLREASTWRAIIGLVVTLTGVSLAPEQADAIVTAGVALYLALEALLPDALRGTDDVVITSTGSGSDDEPNVVMLDDPRLPDATERHSAGRGSVGVAPVDPRGEFDDRAG